MKSGIAFKYDQNTRVLSWQPQEQDIEVCYRVLSSSFRQPLFIRDLKSYDPSGPGKRSTGLRFNTDLPEIENELFRTPNLQKSGSITRGISIGNRQNVFVNSSLNLVLNGTLTENLNINAVITDQNIPYQPEGNTQQLRDFDNVYIKLYNDSFDLTVGDVVLSNPIPESYFLKYYKNVQGGALTYRSKLRGGWGSTSHVAASVAKGQFASTLVDPIEGVLGPYRLRGPEDQRFIIVLANSERVFIDGQLLKRGFQNDYVIDYNLGEITFNTNVVITRFTRIRVDFEFVEQQFSRSNLAVSQRLSNTSNNLYFSFYRERDNPNNTPGIDLNEDALNTLAQLGDATGDAFASGADSIGFDEERVLYEKRDTLVNGESFEIFVNSTDPERAVFNVRFSELGPNQGNYRLQNSTSNGRVFEWIAPANGSPQGNFEPVIQVSAPDQRQLFVIGGESKAGKATFQHELAVSNRDNNLLSTIDDGDNQGLSWKGGIRLDSLFALGAYQLSFFSDFEYNQKYFEAIDRFRYIEFDRDWSFVADTILSDQYITQWGFSAVSSESKFYDYRLAYRTNGNFEGTQQVLNFQESLQPIRLSGEYFFLENEQGQTSSSWLRTATSVEFINKVLVPGYRFNSDENVVKALGTDSVLRSAMNFIENEYYIRNADSSRVIYRLAYANRKDETPVSGTLESFTQTDNYSFKVANTSLKQQYQVDASFRRIRDFLNDQNNDIVQGRLTAINSLLRDHIRSNLSLAISSGRELQREFIYIPVNVGEGTHTWRDENEDGIQDLNEFYEAVNPDEKQYIKLFTPTDEYITAFRNQYTHALDVAMPRSWRQSAGLLKALSKVSYLINLNLDNKTSDSDLLKRLNPYAALGEDEEVISRRNAIRYSVFYNRVAPGFGLEATYRDRERRQLLTNGFEQSDDRSWFYSARLSFVRMYNITLNSTFGRSSNVSDFLESRNFELSNQEINPSFSWQPIKSFRLTLAYNDISKKNISAESSAERSNISEWSVEATNAVPTKGSINGAFTYSNVKFEGEENTFLGYSLLNALQPGRNYQINLSWQQKLSKGLQMTLQYFGRKSGDDSFVHTGNFQMTAFF